MKISLEQTYIDSVVSLARLENEIAKLEEVLKTPARTVDDIVRHIELLKAKRRLS